VCVCVCVALSGLSCAPVSDAGGLAMSGERKDGVQHTESYILGRSCGACTISCVPCTLHGARPTNTKAY